MQIKQSACNEDRYICNVRRVWEWFCHGWRIYNEKQEDRKKKHNCKNEQFDTKSNDYDT